MHLIAFTDVFAGFYTVQHINLLRMYQLFGVLEIALSLIQSYLKNLVPYVEIAGEK